MHDVISSPRGANRYQVLDLLGKGTFGQVVKCLDLEKNEFVAIKIVKNLPAFHSQGLVEVKLLQTINAKYDTEIYPMVRMLDNFIFRNHLCLIFELLNVSLYELIRQNQFRGLSVQLVSIFTKQILTAMVALHQSRIIHCDLKPENILLEDATSPNLKVIDFGSACFDNQAVYTYIQSRFYRSPEVILGLPYKLSIDVWSLGCIVFELFIGLPLFPGLSQHRMLMRFIKFVGMPPYRMLIEAKDTSKFFNRVAYNGNSTDFVLKTDDEYSRHIAALTGNKPVPAQPFREYYKANTIQAIVLGYDMKANLTREQKDEEMAMRRAMLSFIDCVLPWDPEERWTPEQLLAHPFITGKPCPEGRSPKPSKVECDALNPLLQAQTISAERALTASSTMVVAGALVTLPQTQQMASVSQDSQQSSFGSPQSSNTPATSSTTGTSNRMDSTASGNNTPSSYSSSPASQDRDGSGSSSASLEAQATIGVYASGMSDTPGSSSQRSSSFPIGSTGSAGFLSAGSTPGAAIVGNVPVTAAQLAVAGSRVQHQHPGPHQGGGQPRNVAQPGGTSAMQPSYGSRNSSSGSSSGSAALLQSPSGPSNPNQFGHPPHLGQLPQLGTSTTSLSARGNQNLGGVPITPMKAGKVPTLPGLGTSPSSSSSYLMSGQSPMMGKLGLSPRDLQQQYLQSQAVASNPSLMMLDESGTPTNLMALADSSDAPISLSSSSSSSMSSPAHAIVELSHHNALDSPSGGPGKRNRAQQSSGTGNVVASNDPFASVFDSPNQSPAMNTSSSASKRHKMTASDPSSPTAQAGRRHGSGTEKLNHSPRYNATTGLSITTDHPLESFDDASLVTLMDVSSPMKPSTHWTTDPNTGATRVVTLSGTPEHIFPSNAHQQQQDNQGSQMQHQRFAGADMLVDFNYVSAQQQQQQQHLLQQQGQGRQQAQPHVFPSSSFKAALSHQQQHQHHHAHSEPTIPSSVGDFDDNLTFWDGQEALGDYGLPMGQSSSMPQGYVYNNNQQAYPSQGFGSHHFAAALGSEGGVPGVGSNQQHSSRMQGQSSSGYSSAPSSGQLPYGMAPGSTGSLVESRAPFPASNSLLVPGGGGNKSNNVAAGARTGASSGNNAGAAFGLGVSPYEASGFTGMSGGSGSGHHFFSGSFSSASSSFAQPTLGSSFSSQGNNNSGWSSSYGSSMEQGSAFSSTYDQGSSYYGGAGSAGSTGSYSALQASGLPPMSSYLVSPSSSANDQFLKRAAQQQQQQQYQASSGAPPQQSSPRGHHNSPPSSRTFRRQHDTIQ